MLHMKQSEYIIEQFGGCSALARLLDHKHPTTVAGWKSRGFIPSRHQKTVLDLAIANNVALTMEDFFWHED